MSKNEQDFLVLLHGLQDTFAPVTCIIKMVGRTKRELTCIKDDYTHKVVIDFDDEEMSQRFEALSKELTKRK